MSERSSPRAIPSVDEVLRSGVLDAAFASYGRNPTVAALREVSGGGAGGPAGRTGKQRGVG